MATTECEYAKVRRFGSDADRVAVDFCQLTSRPCGVLLPADRTNCLLRQWRLEMEQRHQNDPTWSPPPQN